MSEINIGMVIPNFRDVTSLYRGSGVFFEMRKIGNVNARMMDSVSSASLKEHDVVFMQRPFNANHLQAAKIVKDCHKPLWIDYDDFLLQIPTDNPAHSTYMNDRTINNMLQIMKMADVITVSTKALKILLQDSIEYAGKLFRANDNVIVLNNAYDYFFHHDPVKNDGKPLITWRGSETHFRDVMTYAKPIRSFMDRYKDWKMEFLGANIWPLTETLDRERVTVTEQMDPQTYMNYLKKINPSVHIIPLHNSHFNQAKSNIAWIEATIAGAVCIAPDWYEWRKPGVITYKTEADFFGAMAWCAENPGKLEELRKQSLDAILSNHQLNTVNLIRCEITRRLAVGESISGMKETALIPRETTYKYLDNFEEKSEGMELK